MKLTSGGDVGYVLGARYSELGQVYRVGFSSGELEVREAYLEVASGAEGVAFSALAGPEQVYPREYWLRHESFRLQDAFRNDPVAALSNSRVEPQPHQVSVLVRVTEKMQPRMILADEVGLGKTIEAGLILKELRARGALERVLILTPASLMTQWAWELRSKFNESFQVHDGAYLRSLKLSRPDANPWSIHADVLCSLQLARIESHREDIVKADWDLVIVDEAHHVRRHWDDGNPRPNQAYELIDELHDRVNGLLLLTATPMQLHSFELFSMVTLVEPGLFESYADFESHREQIRRINQMVGALQSGPPGDVHRVELARLLRELGAPPELLATRLDARAGRDLLATWLSRRHRLSEALVRNRKAEVGGFVTRAAHRIPVMPNPGELELERMVSSYIVDEHARNAASRGRAVGFVLVTFQKLLCSSSRALAAALENRARRLLQQNSEIDSDDPDLAQELEDALASAPSDRTSEVQRLREIAAFARQVRDAKLEALHRTLVELFARNRGEKVLIFTQFITTLEMISDRLAGSMSVAVFHGRLTIDQKDAAVQEFKREAQVLISSEAGGEGRNFQFCHIVFNYDLPWNPMKIEQRIGRVDRIGQLSNVFVYNFAVAGTLDERILSVLDQRIRVFTESVGALDPILGDVETDLERMCLQDVESAKRSIQKYEVDLDTRLDRARRQEAQERDLVMDMRSFRRAEVATLLGGRASASPDELERFVIEALRRYPTADARVKAPDIWRISLPAALRRRDASLQDSYEGTFSYRVALRDERLDFFAFGHPLIDRLIADSTEAGFAAGAGVAYVTGTDGARVTADFEVELSGVRDVTELHSQLIGTDTVQSAASVMWQPPLSEEVAREAWHPDDIESVVASSQQELDTYIRTRFDRFAGENATRFDEELARHEKVFRARRHNLEERIERNLRLIEEAESEGDGASRSTAARRGLVTRARRALTDIAFEQEAARASLERRRSPTVTVRALTIAEVVDTRAQAGMPALEQD